MYVLESGWIVSFLGDGYCFVIDIQVDCPVLLAMVLAWLLLLYGDCHELSVTGISVGYG